MRHIVTGMPYFLWLKLFCKKNKDGEIASSSLLFLLKHANSGNNHVAK